MIRKVLEKKYGKFVTDKLMTNNNEVMVENFNRDDSEHQKQVIDHLRRLKDIDGENLVPESFFVKNIEWGMDFSGWIGRLDIRKEFLFIGAEPHIWKNYQVVYSFGTKKHEDLSQTALTYANNAKDIWFYILKNFNTDQSDEGKVDFLNRCYITDLCHIVPKNCGQVDVICKTLNIKKSEWHSFRSNVAKNFLMKEIESVNPKFIVLHGSVAKDFFKKELGVEFTEKLQIADWNRFIRIGKMGTQTVIAIPHLKGQVLNELWRSKKYPERPKAAKEIIQEITTR